MHTRHAGVAARLARWCAAGLGGVRERDGVSVTGKFRPIELFQKHVIRNANRLGDYCSIGKWVADATARQVASCACALCRVSGGG